MIERPNQVWGANITYIPMRRGFVYPFAVIDWHSRRVLAWRLSNTLATDFCLDAAEEAIRRYGRPEIFNTDQGSQFTRGEFTGLLKANGIRISILASTTAAGRTVPLTARHRTRSASTACRGAAA